MTEDEKQNQPARVVSLLAQAGMVLLILLTAGYAVYHWRLVRQREESSMLSMAVMVSNSVDRYLMATQVALIDLRESLPAAPIRDDALPQVRRSLAAFVHGRPEIQLAAIVRDDGQMLATSLRDTDIRPVNIADSPTFQEFMLDHHGFDSIYVGRPQLGRSTGAWGFSLRLPLADAHARHWGHLDLLVSTDFLVTLWKDAPSFAGEKMALGVFRDDGFLIGRHPLPHGVNESRAYGHPVVGALYRHLHAQQFPKEGTVAGRNALAGEELLYAYRRAEHFPLTVFVAQSYSALRQVWMSEVLGVAAAVLLLIVALQIGAHTLTRREAQWITDFGKAERGLRQQEESQRFLIDHMKAGLVVYDGWGVAIRSNAEASRILGMTLEEMAGKSGGQPVWHFLRADGSVMPATEYPVARVLKSRAPVSDYEFGVVRPGQQTPSWISCRADPWFDSQGRVDQIVVTCTDITASHELLRAVADKEERFRSLFEHSMDAIFLTSPDGTIHSVNPAGCQLLRMTEEAIRAGGRDAIVDMTDPAVEELLRLQNAQGQVSGTASFLRGDGTRFTAEVASSIYTDSGGARYASMIVRDVSERLTAQAALESTNLQLQQANSRLVELAHYDPLTHLPNRALLFDRIQQAMAYAQRRGRNFAIAFIDLDGFKDINDTHGHPVGDQLLSQMARRFQNALRAGDTVARLGGDEFVALMTDLSDARDCEPLILRLLQEAAQPVTVDGMSLRVSASIGITSYPDDGNTADILIRHADQAMYMAKQQGKNRHRHFDVAGDSAIRNRQTDIERIARACSAHELVLHYQPQVNMRTGEVIGVEALVRWLHPERGLLAPSLFLPLIEDDDAALLVGSTVLDLALDQLAKWQASGIQMHVAVNLFARQLQRPDFTASFKAQLARHPGVDPRWLALEVVETSALDDISTVIHIMNECAGLGVHFSIDDFGTGYSSLTYLKRLPARMLKIDQSFVRDMLEDQDDLNIVEGVIGLAHAFGRNVLAEGVETVRHARLLLNHGCELGQGYGIGRPMPAQDLHDWLQLWRERQPWL